MRHIHHACLRQWFQGKRVVKEGSVVTTYFWKNLECELCRTAYPFATRSSDGRRLLPIIEYEKPVAQSDGSASQFLVLESISSNTSKVIHVVRMDKARGAANRLYIGRGHDAHIRVTDISVSRLHAKIVRSASGLFFLADNGSKFGTLAQVRTPLELSPGANTQLQIGRSLLTFEVRNSLPQRCRNCCCQFKKSSSNSKSQRRKVPDHSQMMTLNGVDYWPREFASESFCRMM